MLGARLLESRAACSCPQEVSAPAEGGGLVGTSGGKRSVIVLGFTLPAAGFEFGKTGSVAHRVDLYPETTGTLGESSERHSERVTVLTLVPLAGAPTATGLPRRAGRVGSALGVCGSRYASETDDAHSLSGIRQPVGADVALRGCGKSSWREAEEIRGEVADGVIRPLGVRNRRQPLVPP